MSQKHKEEPVTLTVATPFELAENKQITIAPGNYQAVRTQIGIPGYGGKISWTNPEYRLTLTADQEKAMGVKDAGSVLSTEYDVTVHVKSGAMKES